MTLTRAELARGYILGEEPDSPLDGRIVVLEEHEGTAPLERLLETLGVASGSRDAG